MDFKQLREQAGLTLDKAAELSGYKKPTINGLELHGEGSDRLKEKLLEIYGQKPSPREDSPPYRVAPESVGHWRGRAERAERKLRKLAEDINSFLDDARLEEMADRIETEERSKLNKK